MDVLVGLIAGLSMGTVFLGAVIFTLYSNTDTYNRLSARLRQGISPTVVMLSIVIAMPLLWGILGAFAGLAYNLVSSSFPHAGLGSPNFVFTLAILLLAALATLVLFIIRRKMIRMGLIMTIAFAGIFGWILPLLANWR